MKQLWHISFRIIYKIQIFGPRQRSTTTWIIIIIIYVNEVTTKIPCKYTSRSSHRLFASCNIDSTMSWMKCKLLFECIINTGKRFIMQSYKNCSLQILCYDLSIFNILTHLLILKNYMLLWAKKICGHNYRFWRIAENGEQNIYLFFNIIRFLLIKSMENIVK